MIYSDQLCISIIFPSQSAAYTKTAFFPPSYSAFTSSPICLPPFSSNSSNVFSTSSTSNARCAIPHLFKACRNFLYISGMIPSSRGWLAYFCLFKSCAATSTAFGKSRFFSRYFSPVKHTKLYCITAPPALLNLYTKYTIISFCQAMAALKEFRKV